MYVVSLPCTKALPIGYKATMEESCKCAVIVNSDLYAYLSLFLIIDRKSTMSYIYMYH